MVHDADDARLAAIEQRLSAIEKVLNLESTSQFRQKSPSVLSEPQTSSETASAAAAAFVSEQPLQDSVAPSRQGSARDSASARLADLVVPAESTAQRAKKSPPSKTPVSPATVMAYGAAASFVLAATYFLGLLINSGWLTPLMQLLIAAGVGVSLIFAGLGLARYDRRYASYLPAVGIIVLYLTVYAGQLYHRILNPALSTLLICVITVGALALGRQFKRDAYSICAVLGVYLSPLLLQLGGPSQTSIVFYTVWCLVFCALAVQSGNRKVYLLAVYLAMFSFDAAYRINGGREWMSHAVFQLFQFLAFSISAALISIHYRVPMTKSEAIAHAPPLFYFYLLEFAIFKEHAPQLFPWVGLASVAVVVTGYFIARRFVDTSKAESGATLVSSFASIVLAHIIFFELLPLQWLPWGALVVGIIGLAAFRRLGASRTELMPVWIVAAFICLAGCGLALTDALKGTDATVSAWILPVYAAVLYGTFWRLQTVRVSESASTLCLYSGHLALMVAAIRILDDQLLISVAWGLMAVSLLFVSWKARIRMLGQSSLFIFAVSAIKVVIYDLSGSAPFIRIGVLLILAVSLYAGGWLYQRLAQETMRYHENDEVNEHIRMVLELERKGMEPSQIAEHLTTEGVGCLAASGWTEKMVQDIVTSYSPQSV